MSIGQTELAALMLQHFPSTTTGDQDLCWRKCKSYSEDECRKAIEEHHLEQGSRAYRPDAMRIGAILLRARQGQRPTYSGKEKIVTWIRRASPCGSTYVGQHDDAVIASHFSQAWKSTQNSGEPVSAIKAIQKTIKAHARQAFIEIGFGEADAHEIASTLVDLDPAEKSDSTPTPSQLIADAMDDERKVEAKAAPVQVSAPTPTPQQTSMDKYIEEQAVFVGAGEEDIF